MIREINYSTIFIATSLVCLLFSVGLILMGNNLKEAIIPLLITQGLAAAGLILTFKENKS